MARPVKTGLSYFPKDVDYYDDLKIIDLMNEYGPLGQTIYDIVVSMVYHEGYFLEFSDYEQLKEKLPIKIIKTIGNRWENSKNHVLQVILSCADIGLFNKDLLMQGVITSVGIQRRYDEVTVRSKVQKNKYRLIDKTGQPLLNVPKTSVNATETRVNVAEIGVDVAETQQKKSKENQSKEKKTKGSYFKNAELNKAFCLYLLCRKNNNDGVNGEQIALLIQQLEKLSSDVSEQIAIVNKATMSNWKSFYPLKSDKKNVRPKNSHQFKERDYSNDFYKSLERNAVEKAKRNCGKD